jgi:plastocyanin
MRSSLVFACLLSSLAHAGNVKGKTAAKPGSIVYIAEIPGRTFAPPSKPVLLEQRGQAFVPHILPILRGTTVRFPNNDQVRHNVFSPAGPQPFNFGIYPPGATKELTFDRLGVVLLLCNIHENMSGYILVLQNPYWAAVGGDGRFAMDNVPDGAYTVVLWSEGKPPQSRRLTVRGDAELEF